MAITWGIDAHAAIQELEAAGIKPEHAEAIVKTVSHQADAQLATKADLATLEGRIDSLEHRRQRPATDLPPAWSSLMRQSCSGS